MYPSWVYLASHATLVIVWTVGAAWLLLWPASDEPYERQRTAIALAAAGACALWLGGIVRAFIFVVDADVLSRSPEQLAAICGELPDCPSMEGAGVGLAIALMLGLPSALVAWIAALLLRRSRPRWGWMLGGAIATAAIGWTVYMHAVPSRPFWPPPLSTTIEARHAHRDALR
jgi:hypothetical protein